MISVSLVEDDPVIRDFFVMTIERSGSFSPVLAYANGRDALDGLSQKMTDVVLVDINLPDTTGLDLLRMLRGKYPEIRVVILTIHAEDEFIFEAFCNGASGYLLKDITSEQLIRAIKEVCEGGAPMSHSVARLVIESFQRREITTLTAREKEVLQHLAVGKTYQSIADDLFISRSTVHKHVKSIYRKLEVGSKTEALYKAMKDKLL